MLHQPSGRYGQYTDLQTGSGYEQTIISFYVLTWNHHMFSTFNTCNNCNVTKKITQKWNSFW